MFSARRAAEGSGLLARLLGLVHMSDGAGVVLLQRWIYLHGLASRARLLNGSLACAIAFLLLRLGVMWPAYRRGCRLRA